MVKKIILLIFALLLFVKCDMAMDKLDVRNGTKYIVTSKKKEVNYHYAYRLIKEGDRFYDYHYLDTMNFNVGDTLVLTIKKVNNNYGNN